MPAGPAPRAVVTNTGHIRIGFGRYQIQLFLLTGLGWMADSASSPLFMPLCPLLTGPSPPDIWLQGVAVVLPQVQQELNPVRIEFATLALYVGLILGATVWGVMADVIGRKLSFNVRASSPRCHGGA